MNILQEILDDRDDANQAQRAAEERWLRVRAGIDPAERLQSWDRWVRGRLRDMLVWPAGAQEREKRIAQCAAEMTVLAKQLRGRGWLLDGAALAQLVDAVLEPIGKAQRGGKVADFWPYFRASVKRYVGVNAEEIQQKARRTGADAGMQPVGALLAAMGLDALQTVPAEPSMTELLVTRAAEVTEAKAETLRARQARVRAQESAQQAACKADAQQTQLL